MVSLQGDEPALARLDQIEEEIAGAIREGILFPSERETAAATVMNLYAEAKRISERPRDYHPPEPCDLDEPEQRAQGAVAEVYAVFRGSPAEDTLCDALIDHWSVVMAGCASRGDAKEYARLSGAMRKDAENARRTRPEPCGFAKPEPPADPNDLLAKLALLTKQAHDKAEATPEKKRSTWERASVQALATLQRKIEFVAEESSSGGAEPGRLATAEAAAALAEEFNELRFAMGRRCPSKKR